jgi:transcriptional regulator with AAA-type ATPase domain
MPEGSTLSATEDPRGRSGSRRVSHLFLALSSHRPLAPPMRLSLDGVSEVVIGRGARASVERARDGAATRLVVKLDDPWLSSTHASLVRVLGRWAIEDRGSKNGCFVSGERATRAELGGGEVLEMGHSFFVLGAGSALDAGGGSIVDASALAAPHPALATLSPAIGRDVAQLARVACSTVPVILEGETGTGKEVAARAIHELSGRTGELVAVNCGALPRDLVEAELFGHKKGAFSGATEDRAGLVRAADRGTLLLDEVGDLPLGSQATLLRVLQEREVRPVGATRATSVDLRVIAATHRPLDRMVDEGRFRADLLARLAGYRMLLPPLRERREDLGLLLASLLRRLSAERAPEVAIRPRAARALFCHDWPGNVRELEKCLAAALVLSSPGPINLEHLPAPVRGALDRGAAARRAADEEHARELVALLREHEGNIAAVARAMGKARMQVQRMMKKHDLDPASFRRG